MSAGKISFIAALLLAACGGNPLLPDDTDGGVDLPPGTEQPSAGKKLQRYEALDESNGNGYAEDITYDAETDTLSVDNLAFDGDNTYDRDNQVADLGPFQVYEGKRTQIDPETQAVISQFTHKAIRGESISGGTEFAIVRTGSYVNYGFGGFVYQRNGGVSIPSSGQAGYTGDYAGLRDFEGAGGLEYVRGRMAVAIDFKDFNDGAGVAGAVTNRRVYNTAGQEITPTILAALSDKYDRTQTAMPSLVFTVGPDTTTEAGEFTNAIGSYVVDGQGALVPLDSGNYYAVLSGANADEVVGVLVVEGDDPRVDGVTTRETGGFILYRDED